MNWNKNGMIDNDNERHLGFLEYSKLSNKAIKKMEENLNRKLTDEEIYACKESVKIGWFSCIHGI
jgi:hypothetical protein